MWVMVPWALALGFAAIARLIESEEGQKKGTQRSIELCVGSCSATWLSEDGVLRVYAERTAIECYRLVVDCSTVPSIIPGEVDGWPVLIRMGSKEAASQRAGRLFAKRAVEIGYELRPVATKEGQISTITTDGDATQIYVEGPQISRRLIEEAHRLAEESGASVSIEPTSPLGPFGHQAACVVRFVG